MGGSLSKPDPSRSTLEVVGAGYSRTGTSSMQLALERLVDGPIYHGGTQIWLSGDDKRTKLWALACDAKFVQHDAALTRKLVREAVRGYAGLVDIPGIWFVPELVELFPDVRVVLNTREPEQWWPSFSSLLDHLPPLFGLLTAPHPSIRWIPGGIFRGFRLSVDELLVANGSDAGVYGPQILELYQNDIIKTVPKEQLVVMEVKDGWKPLAEFLKKPVPEEDFPRVNEKAALDRQANAILTKLVLTWAGILVATGGSAYLGWLIWQCQY
ncbi:uncharacterized protein PG998_011226 [Apiospora kogelbergensis]|uniref:uncharacterized protein n=1 Tax=Apiospora kogelbergensis TaxID=1337665 RepID=UPI0031316EE9